MVVAGVEDLRKRKGRPRLCCTKGGETFQLASAEAPGDCLEGRDASSLHQARDKNAPLSPNIKARDCLVIWRHASLTSCCQCISFHSCCHDIRSYQRTVCSSQSHASKHPQHQTNILPVRRNLSLQNISSST
ncbi:hypothetical protein Pmani_021837 [Petrolisthes manimaculis]|uniref:Uncharacterized protein n=1 Tax=Petrolisthes manimaculis TaxID=1843537 RepID=A0AAE1PDY9_9EUCA|nr:hypothetical protein Pmani_021837 [Petrolisthes manimaculis]